MPIRIRLTLWYIGLLGAILLLFCASLYFVLDFSLRHQVDQTLQDRAQQVITAIQKQTVFDFSTGNLFLPEVNVFSSPATFIQVIQPDGRLVSASDNLGGQHIPLDADILAANLRGESTFKTVTIDNMPLRIYSTPIIFGHQVLGAVEVGQSLMHIETTLRYVLVFLTTGAISAVVLAALVGVFLARTALRPIEKISQTANQIVSGQDLKQRLPSPKTNDELAHLTETINHMLQRLDNFFQAQVRLSADVSHELRTPLTTIRGNIDLLRRNVGRSHECATCRYDELGESLTVMESELDRMSRLVADLLLLSQADAGLSLRMQPVELDTLILDVYRQTRGIANGVNIQLGHEDQALIQGDPDRLKQLLMNLLLNAIRYTPPAGHVTLSLYRESEWVRVQVTDTGRGIAPTDLPHIFERFYRAENNSQTGSGLGLSIAQWIAQVHGGQITVSSEVDQGAVFTLWLPCPHEASATGPSKQVIG